MPRVKHAVSSLKRRKKVLDSVKGQRGSRSKLLRTAKEVARKALIANYIDRKVKKRDFRSLWIVRISAACKALGTSYNKLISSLKKADIILDRKMLAEIAANDANGFKSIVEKVIK